MKYQVDFMIEQQIMQELQGIPEYKLAEIYD